MSVVSEQEYQQRIAALERQCATLAAEVDNQRAREHALSDAYLRLRRIIGKRAFDTPHAPTAEQVWTTTEIALAELVAQVDRQRAVVTVAEVIVDYGMSTARYSDLQVIVDKYRTTMAQLAKESR